jgi:hypothetical protein
MSDEDRVVTDTEASDVADEGVRPPDGRQDRTRRHLVVLVVAVVGLAIGGALVISGRSSSNGDTAKRTTSSTLAAGDLLPSLGVVPDVAAAKALLARLDPRSLRPDPNATTTSGPVTTAHATTGPSSTSTPASGDATTATNEPGLEATQNGVRRCAPAIEQQTIDRSLGDELAAARLQVGVATDLVVSYALPASGKDPAAVRVLLVGGRSCKVLAAIQH